MPGKSHGRRSLKGCSPWDREESDTTEQLHFHFSLSCIGEGNGNPHQCSCLENPRDGGAWWAALYGVAQSRTRLKRLSSSSSSSSTNRDLTHPALQWKVQSLDHWTAREIPPPPPFFFFLVVLSLCCCSLVFSSRGEQRLLSNCGVGVSL